METDSKETKYLITDVMSEEKMGATWGDTGETDFYRAATEGDIETEFWNLRWSQSSKEPAKKYSRIGTRIIEKGKSDVRWN